jgi:hypothetical protein
MAQIIVNIKVSVLSGTEYLLVISLDIAIKSYWKCGTRN